MHVIPNDKVTAEAGTIRTLAHGPSRKPRTPTPSSDAPTLTRRCVGEVEVGFAPAC